MRCVLISLVVLIFVFPRPVTACLWDYDTLQQERSKYPEVHELIVGHFVRHSDVYYRWRIENRTAKSSGDRTPQDYDDIAVAYEKLGQHEKAIEVIKEKIARWPDQFRYESEANLGTFLIHAGRFEEGLKHIEAAIDINPDAHFGREVYQKLLVEYVLAKRAAGISGLPLDQNRNWNENSPIIHQNFQDFIYDRDDDDTEAAIQGVLGMMRFGNHDSPILLEALGDLMAHSRGQRLTARAYLVAYLNADDSTARGNYYQKARAALNSQVDVSVDDILPQLQRELEEAEAYFAQIQADETAWAAAGLDLDDEFRKKYYDAPQVRIGWNDWISINYYLQPLVLCPTIASVLMIVLLFLKRRRTKPGSAASYS